MNRFDELVFENRNKDYGAYELRKRYFRNFLKAVIITLIFSLISLLSLMYYVYTETDITYKMLRDTSGVIEFANFDIDPIPVDPQKNVQVQQVNEALTEIARTSATEVGTEEQQEAERMIEESLSKMELDLNTDVITDLEKSLDQNTRNTSTTVYDLQGAIVNTENEFRRFIAQNTKYPDSALNSKINGMVMVQFVFTNRGDIKNIILLKKAHPILDREALRVVKAIPRSRPIILNGKAITVMYKLPIVFKM